MNFAPLAWVYFTIVASTLALTVISMRPWLMWGAAVMMSSWLMSNEAVVAYGYPGFIKSVAICDGILAVLVAAVGIPLKSTPLAIVFGLFILEEMTHLGLLVLVRGLSTNVTHGLITSYVVVLNMIFLAQCVTIGAAGVRAGLVDRIAAHPIGARRLGEHWGSLVRGLARRKA